MKKKRKKQREKRKEQTSKNTKTSPLELEQMKNFRELIAQIEENLIER